MCNEIQKLFNILIGTTGASMFEDHSHRELKLSGACIQRKDVGHS